MNIIYAADTITQKRAQVRAHLFKQSPNIKNEKITLVNVGDLVILFGIYDEIFLKNFFLHHPQLANIRFSWSKRLTKAAGKTIFYRKKTALGIEKSYEIRMATDFFWEYEKVSREIKVCGIKTADAVDALLIVFEHELCHLIEYIMTGNSSCHQKAFHIMAGNLFGHTEFTHQLPTKREIAHTHYGFQVGDKVKFAFKDQFLTGVLHKIHKRAIIMVLQKNGAFIDAAGKRYEQYYVPLEILTKI